MTCEFHIDFHSKKIVFLVKFIVEFSRLPLNFSYYTIFLGSFGYTGLKYLRRYTDGIVRLIPILTNVAVCSNKCIRTLTRITRVSHCCLTSATILTRVQQTWADPCMKKDYQIDSQTTPVKVTLRVQPNMCNVKI